MDAASYCLLNRPSFFAGYETKPEGSVRSRWPSARSACTIGSALAAEAVRVEPPLSRGGKVQGCVQAGSFWDPAGWRHGAATSLTTGRVGDRERGQCHE